MMPNVSLPVLNDKDGVGLISLNNFLMEGSLDQVYVRCPFGGRLAGT